MKPVIINILVELVLMVIIVVIGYAIQRFMFNESTTFSAMMIWFFAGVFFKYMKDKLHI